MINTSVDQHSLGPLHLDFVEFLEVNLDDMTVTSDVVHSRIYNHMIESKLRVCTFFTRIKILFYIFEGPAYK